MLKNLSLLILLAGCTADGNLNPIGVFSGLPTDSEQAATQQRRGAVEIIVKSNFAAVLGDIDAGGGPVLTRAMDAARIPAQDRPTRIIQLQSNMALYEVNPGALVSALMLYGG
jgi:hypothetical protein